MVPLPDIPVLIGLPGLDLLPFQPVRRSSA